jgi:Yip1 domain
MDERNDNELQNEETQEEELLEDEYELTHSDKLVGVFSEPSATFQKMAQSPVKTTDWLIPLLTFIIVLSLSTIMMQTNQQIKYSMMEKQLEAIEVNFSEAVNSGRMTQEQADTQMENIRERMDEGGMAMLIPQIVGIVIFSFIVFFVISGFYFAITKFVLKGDGPYGNAMVAYGLPFYIASVQVILQVIVAMLMSKMVTDLSLTTFLGLDKTEISGFLLSKLDLVSIWFYVVVGIAYAKLFKSENTKKYVGIIIGLWIGFSLLFFYLAKQFTFLSFLNQ